MATATSSNIFHNWERPRKTSEGIVVIKAIGINTLKKILRVNENEFKGNLPMYSNDLNTSVAFHVFTNQIVVVEIKNHKLYKIQIEHIMVIKHKIRKLKLKFIWFILMQYNNKRNPSIISKMPEGVNFFKEMKNWLSIGFKSTKSKVPSLMCLTISVRLGLNHVLVIPFKIV